MDYCATVKVKPWGTGQGEYVEVNADEFDPKIHDLIGSSEKAEPAKPAAKAKAAK